jgi:hypothetical protein
MVGRRNSCKGVGSWKGSFLGGVGPEEGNFQFGGLLSGIGGVCKLSIGVLAGVVALGSTFSTNLTALVFFPVGAVVIVVKR